MGMQGWTICGQSFLAPTESLCTPGACWTVRNISRVGIQTHGPALCVALNGQQEHDLPIQQSWVIICQDHDWGEGGRRWEVPCSFPNSLRRTAPGWCRPVT